MKDLNDMFEADKMYRERDNDLHRWQMIAAGLYECRECGTEFNLIKRKPKERPICNKCYNLTEREQEQGTEWT